MSGDNNNLVNDIMQQLEQQNGSYNGDIGEFSNKASGEGGSRVMNNLRQKFLSIIGENQGLKELISSNPKYQQIINDVLGHEELLKDLLKDPSIIPAVITSILNQEGDDDEKESPLPSMEISNKAQGFCPDSNLATLGKAGLFITGSLSSPIPDININPNLNASCGAEATNNAFLGQSSYQLNPVGQICPISYSKKKH